MRKSGKLTKQVRVKSWTKEQLLEFLAEKYWIEMRLNNINEKIYGEIIIVKEKK